MVRKCRDWLILSQKLRSRKKTTGRLLRLMSRYVLNSPFVVLFDVIAPSLDKV